MALAFHEAFHDAALEAPPTYEDELTFSPDVEAHVQTYRKFVRFARIAACGVPFFMVFLLYWLN